MFSKNSFRAAIAVVACAFTLSLASHAEVSVGSKTARPLITQKIDENNLVTREGNTRPEARNATYDRGAVDGSTQMPAMQLLLHRSPEQQAALNKLMDQLHTPGSPNFHKWLTATEFAESFGVSQQDVAAVKEWLEGQGLKVTGITGTGLQIEFTGSVADVNAAFHTEIHNVADRNGDVHFANISDPQIPAELAKVVVGPTTLNTFPPHNMIAKRSQVKIDAKTHDLVRVTTPVSGNGKNAGPEYTNGTEYDLAAGDIQKIYNITPIYTAGFTGSGMTIGFLEDTPIYATSDFTTYQSTFGLTSYGGSFAENSPTGGMTCTAATDNSDDIEAELDVEMGIAVAPGAKIVDENCADTAVFGGLIAYENLENSATFPQVISMSYGECEAANGSASNASFSTAFEQGAAEGMSTFVSAGDNDTQSCDQAEETSANQDYYGAWGLGVTGWGETPYNVAVGGTDFGDTYAGTNSTYWSAGNSSTFESALSYVPEIPWNDSCASQLIYTIEGSTESAYCNSAANYPNGLRDDIGGGGGYSTCATGGATVAGVVSGTCAGYAQPRWQTGLFGVPTTTPGYGTLAATSTASRTVPDVSLFAANGVWSHDILICYTNGYTCTAGSPSGWVGIGGTSASAPMMASIQALINQYTGELQGNPNYILYSLAKTEYGASGSSTCNSTLGNGVGSSCVFYDVTQGDNDPDCKAGYNCYVATGTYGVASFVNAANDPAYPTTTGYDTATGIGSVNAFNLAAAWKAYVNSAPTVTVTASPANLAAGQVVTFATTVTGSGTYPTGTVTFSVSNGVGTVGTAKLPLSSSSSTSCTTTCSSATSFAYTIPVAATAGSYTVTATYSTVNEQYPTASGTAIYNVTANSTSSALSASPTTIAFNASTTLTDVISWPTTTAINPTGSVALSSSIAQEGTFQTIPLSSCTISLSAKTATCSYLWTPTYGGTQTITAAYSGDTNYSASSGTTSLNVTQNSTSTTLSISPSTVTATVIGTTYTTVTTYTGSSAPTGMVTLGGTPAGGPALSMNFTSCTTNTSAKTITCAIADPNAWNEYNNGIYEVTATYSGDPADAPSTSAAQQFVVAGSTTSTLTFTLGTTSSTYATGGTTLATVVLAGKSAGGVPSGSITITGTGALGTLATITLPTATNSQCTLATRTWTCTATLTIPAGTAAGAYTLTAAYSGNANYTTETKTATYTINKATPTAAASGVSGAYESTVTLSATDTGVTSGVAPTGTVTFTVNGATATGTPTCSGAALVETCTLSYTITAAETPGTYPITALFATDTNYNASNTASATLTVTADTASFGTMSFSPAASEPVGTSQAITISDTLTFSGPAPTGAVTYVLNGVTYTATCGATSPATCTATVPATTIAALAVNTYTVTAALAAGGGYSATTGASGTFTITSVSASFGTMSFSPAASEPQGTSQAITISDTLTFSGAKPSGAVTYVLNGVTYTATCGATSPATCTATVPAATIAALAANTYTVTAALAAGGGYSATTGTSGTFTITAVAANIITFTSVSHNFGQVAVGTKATAYGLTITNTGTTAYPFSLVFTAANGFTEANNCGASIAAGAKCQLDFYFTPTATGPVSATWSLAPEGGFSYTPSNGGTLQGSGTSNGGVSLTTNGHNFGSEPVGTMSATYGTELSNSTTSAETLTLGPVPSGPFTMLTNCGTTLAAGASCEIEFTFKPTATGVVQVIVPLSGTPTAITSGGAALPNGGITLTGTGAGS